MTRKKKLNKTRSQVSSIYKQLDMLYCSSLSLSQPSKSSLRSLSRAGIASCFSSPRATIFENGRLKNYAKMNSLSDNIFRPLVNRSQNHICDGNGASRRSPTSWRQPTSPPLQILELELPSLAWDDAGYFRGTPWYCNTRILQ